MTESKALAKTGTNGHARQFTSAVHKLESRLDQRPNRVEQSGFSLLELAVVMGIVMVMLVVSMPVLATTLYSYRVKGDASSISNMISLARMRAAAGFAHGELVCSSTQNYCQVQVVSSDGTTTQEMTRYLSTGVSFSTAGVSAGAGNQTGAPVQNLTMIFNSRGYPINSSNAVVSNYAIYMQSQDGRTYAVGVATNGQPSLYQYKSGSWSLVQ